MKIWIIGPNRLNLERLQIEWLEWLEENVSKPVTRAGKDTSIPNLSSIMLLVEAGGRQILLPGDGTGKDILEGLQNLGKLDASGNIHVDILKLPHHGSMRNASGEFFQKVTADLYVISANKNNPDFETLEWIVAGAQSQNRSIQILATNETQSTLEFMQKYDQNVSGYTIIHMQAGQHYVTV
jgi:beta-lactamase superfamily II metal-dependent hydrolase